MQLYLVRVENGKEEDDPPEFALLDGDRSVDQPLVNFTRSKLAAGNYLLFYRCAWKDPVFKGSGIGGTGDY
jgi:hypothetical protein